ncbi:T-cell surface glycoprotein CD3 zeta chain isoform X2 [Canis aureus]
MEAHPACLWKLGSPIRAREGRPGARVSWRGCGWGWPWSRGGCKASPAGLSLLSPKPLLFWPVDFGKTVKQSHPLSFFKHESSGIPRGFATLGRTAPERGGFGRSAAAPEHQQGPNQLYNELNLRGREEYEVLDKRRGLDPEMGGKQRKRNPQEVVYNALQKDKMAEAYSEIGIKSENQRRRGKGHDGLYQGLSTATKDTYDALHMQALPPR